MKLPRAVTGGKVLLELGTGLEEAPFKSIQYVSELSERGKLGTV